MIAEAAACGIAPWVYATREALEADQLERCDGRSHKRLGAVVRRCPVVVLADERESLAGPLARLGGVPTWEGYKPGLVEGGAAALRALYHLAAEPAPARGVYASGPIGTGKTRLWLTAHFARLASGFASVYRTTADLRPLFRAVTSYDLDAQADAIRKIQTLARCPVIFLDDLGDATDTPDFHRGFQDGLKMLLDLHGGVVAASNNLDRAASEKHPDIGPRNVSRLLERANVVVLAGPDQRLASARAAT